MGSSLCENLTINSNDYLDIFIFRKLSKQKNTELLKIHLLKVLVNQQEVVKLLVNNNRVNKVLVVLHNNVLLLLKMKNEKLMKKLLNLNVKNVKSDIHYSFLPDPINISSFISSYN